MRARGHEVLLICATDEHGTPAELAAARAGRAGRRLLRAALGDPEGAGRRLPPVVRPLRPLVEPAEPPADPAFRRAARRRRPDLGGQRAADLLARRRALPARPLRRGHLPELRLSAGARRPVRELHQAARPDRPDRAALGDLGLDRPRGARDDAPLPAAERCCSDELRAWIATKTDWPVLSTSIALKWLDDGEGLQDRSITRDLDWGIPVRRGDAPWPGMEGKVFYVWFDAPIEYIGATAEWAEATGRTRRPGGAGGGPTRARRTSPTSSSWARTTCRSTR